MVEKTSSDVKNRYLDANEEPNRWLNPIEGYEDEELVSLTESVQRIKGLVNDQQTKELVGEKQIQNLIQELDRNIWIAGNNSSEPNEDLSKDESAAIHLYTMHWSNSNDNLSTVINTILRCEKRAILKPWFSFLKLILTALFNLPSRKGIIWRGVRGNFSDQYQKEKVWWGFSSCTETMGQIDQFLGRTGERTIFMIDCMHGKAIRNHSKFPDENEILLMPGTYFHVIDKYSPAEGLYIIHLQEATPPHELRKPPSRPQLPPSVPSATLDSGISSKDTAKSYETTRELLDRPKSREKAREKLMHQIHEEYINHGKYKSTRMEHRNIMLVGHERTGKSTVKALLVDPTTVSRGPTLVAETRQPRIESLYLNDCKMELNIIDTPGLLERCYSEYDSRDIESLLYTIEICVNREITKFHVICFCMSVTHGITQKDIYSIRILIDFFGPEAARNSCLIITRCESMNNERRAHIIAEFQHDVHLKELTQYFKLGVYFSGALNYADFYQGSECLVGQLKNICKYREQLIQLFSSNIEPFPISETLISELRQTRLKLEKMKAVAEERAPRGQKLEKEPVNDKKQAKSDQSGCRMN